ncbi:MAG: ArgE/DapE family deacylase [Candidatus Heimdallarchaeota archaeon]|nr:ArgE/DapE family deacylase [Candidatus Heimdallarchaeota archaeon]
MNAHHQDLLELLQGLIKINSVNPMLDSNAPGELEITSYLGKYMEKMGLEVHYQTIEENRANVIGILRGKGGGKSLMLNGHLDTVAVGQMKEPFTAKYEEGKIYGRGAIDMKSGVASMIYAVETIMQQGIALRGDVIITAVIDEEYASIGTEEVLKEYKADAAIVTEPTDLQVCVAHKGFTWTKISVFGRAAHGSLPDEGVDAIVKMGKVLVALEDLQNKVFPTITHPILGNPSIHASLIEGGTGLSTYPDKCVLQLERRLLPFESRKDVVDEMKKLVDSIKQSDLDFDADVDVFFHRPGLEIDRDHALVVALSKSYKNNMNKGATYMGVNFWMDAALIADAGIPCVAFGPTGKGLHADIEYVEFDSVIQCADILTKTIIDYCG